MIKFLYNLNLLKIISQIAGIGKSPLAGLAALGLGGLAPANTGGLNPAGRFVKEKSLHYFIWLIYFQIFASKIVTKLIFQ